MENTLQYGLSKRSFQENRFTMLVFRLLISAMLIPRAEAYQCRNDGVLDCASANITEPLIVGPGPPTFLRHCKYSNCPSIFVDGGELRLENVTLSHGTSVDDSGALTVLNGALTARDLVIDKWSAPNSGGLVGRNATVQLWNKRLDGLINDSPVIGLESEGGAILLVDSRLNANNLSCINSLARNGNGGCLSMWFSAFECRIVNFLEMLHRE